MNLSHITISSPLGELIAVADDNHLLILEFADSKQLEKKLKKLGFVIPSEAEGPLSKSSYEKKGSISLSGQEKGIPPEGQKVNYILPQAQKELSEYFAGTRKFFSIPLAPSGTDFQKKAWEALSKIPYGETRNYKEQAIIAGNPKAVRAIGGANNKNPIVIIVPCHRVIGSSGDLVGYGGGIERKKWLLEFEREKNNSTLIKNISKNLKKL